MMRQRQPELDKYDVAILSALLRNTRLTTVELARKVHLSRTAVSRRIARLRRINVLNDAGDVLNYELIGFKVRAKVELSTHGLSRPLIKSRLLEKPEVLSVYELHGGKLLCLDVIAVDMDHLQSFAQSIRKDGDLSIKVIFAEEKSPLTLLERVRRLGEESVIGLTRV